MSVYIEFRCGKGGVSYVADLCKTAESVKKLQ